MSDSDLDARSILGPGGAISRRLSSYEARSEQMAMAEGVERAIRTKSHLMVEAGTGVGKSFAYLVPAIRAAAESKLKVVVSTHTIHLQEQLHRKDIPFLRSVMPFEFSAVLVKGRSNYVSLRRLDGAVARAGSVFNRPEEFDQLAALRLWARNTDDGSRSDLEIQPLPTVWEAVESDHGNCMGRKCGSYSACHHFKARRRANSANILVVNHALYMVDVALRAAGSSFLPDHDVVIFDEAHTLAEVAGNHLGLRITSGSVAKLLNRLYNVKTRKGLLVYHNLDDARQQAKNALHASERFFESIRSWREREAPSNGRAREPLKTPEILSEELKKLASAITFGAERIQEEEQRIELTSAAERCLGVAASLRDWMRQSLEGSVYWVEIDPRHQQRVAMACTPIDVGPLLRRYVWERVPTCILTSATLSVGKPPSFGYTRGRLGLVNAENLQLGSPFDYPKQAVIHIAKNLPDPALDPSGFEQTAISLLPHYLAMTHGKAFVLFTSYRMLESAVRRLRPWFSDQKIQLLTQLDGKPRSKMLDDFRSDEDSVIFGVDSFWQGVDVAGKALSNVIIPRLPFAVPDTPQAEAQSQAYKQRGENYFQEVSLPEAVLKFKQGFGRLIRGKTDTGIVVILDPRVLTKSYGRLFLDSLPDCPRVVQSIDSIAKTCDP